MWILISTISILFVLQVVLVCSLGDNSDKTPTIVEKGSYEIIKCPGSAEKEYKIIFHLDSNS